MYPAPDGQGDAECKLTTASLSNYFIFSGFILKTPNLQTTFLWYFKFRKYYL